MKCCGLGKARRLTSSALIRNTFDHGSRHVGVFMVMWVHRDADASLRLAVVASRRMAALAVERNRAKRKLREVFRCNRRLIARSDVNIVLVARRAILKAGMEAIREDFLKLAGKAGLLAGKL